MSGPAAPRRVRSVVIVGGGTAGWMTAAALSHRLGPHGVRVTLIESDAIGTVGVGEATLPHIRAFNQSMGLDEAEMMALAQATIKLGIQFVGWGRPGEAYIHPFGDYGAPLDGVPFHHLWTRRRGEGRATPLDDHSLAVRMAEADRFEPPSDDPTSLRATYNYAFQMDAGLYAAWLSRVSQERGVRRVEGRITRVRHEGDRVSAVELETGERVEGELFVDCSGFRALLIGDTLGEPFEDWGHWLPCDRAWAVPCTQAGPASPYTRATARAAGWQWRIPLQHRVGNGHVYASAYMSDDEARSVLVDSLEAPPLAEPRPLRFQAGCRRRPWRGNVVAIGLSGGFLEPLESTSIYLIQEGITHLVDLFPDHDTLTLDAAEFNRRLTLEFDRIRDFLVLHYVANQRDEPFWRDRREGAWPDSLAETVQGFQSRGLLPDYDLGVFRPLSWLAVLVGQNIVPHGHDPRADRLGEEAIDRHMGDVARRVREEVEATGGHAAWLDRHARGRAA